MLFANTGKQIIIKINGQEYARYPIKTKLITPTDQDLLSIIKQYASSYLQAGDIIFVSEKMAAITQGRAWPLDKIKAGFLARFLSRRVYKNPAGIGLSIPETMQLAITEVGWLRILLAAIISFLTKPFGLRGMFYRIAGRRAAAIDGPVPYAIPPYNTYASLGPKNPKLLAQKLADSLKAPVVIADANDLGVVVLGASRGLDKKLICQILQDNPLGQSDEGTPIGIIRKL